MAYQIKHIPTFVMNESLILSGTKSLPRMADTFWACEDEVEDSTVGFPFFVFRFCTRGAEGLAIFFGGTDWSSSSFLGRFMARVILSLSGGTLRVFP